MIDVDAQPGLGWELQGTTDEIADDIAMSHDQCVALLLLLRKCTMKVATEGGFDAGTITEELLQFGSVQIDYWPEIEVEVERERDYALTEAAGFQWPTGGCGGMGAPSRRLAQCFTLSLS